MDQDEAVEFCREILDLIEELPERAADFGESVKETVEDIMSGAEQYGEITEKQVTALENIKTGVEKWLT